MCNNLYVQQAKMIIVTIATHEHSTSVHLDIRRKLVITVTLSQLIKSGTDKYMMASATENRQLKLIRTKQNSYKCLKVFHFPTNQRLHVAKHFILVT
jgi:hypothetical protein